MPSRALLSDTDVSFTLANLMYSHSARRKRPPHMHHSRPRPAVQPGTNWLLLCSLVEVETEGTGEKTGGRFVVVTVPVRLVVVTTWSSRSTTLLETERETSIRPTAKPPNM